MQKNIIQSQEDLQKIQKESTEQVLPQQKKVLSAADKIRRKTSNLPDPTHPPMGWKYKIITKGKQAFYNKLDAI